LTGKQVDRLRQISLRMRGGDALADPTVQEQLRLDAKQKSRIEEILRASRVEADELDPRRDGAGAFRELRRRRESRLLAVLNAAQTEGWNGLLGDPFALEP
jgi:hypothetical protein